MQSRSAYICFLFSYMFLSYICIFLFNFILSVVSTKEDCGSYWIVILKIMIVALVIKVVH